MFLRMRKTVNFLVFDSMTYSIGSACMGSACMGSACIASTRIASAWSVSMTVSVSVVGL